MKYKFYILISCLMAGLSSCNDWLDLQPQTEMNLKDMYASQQGFQEVLTGVYLDLKSNSVYGRELMFGTVEYLAQHWDYAAESPQEKISRYNYIDESVQSYFSDIYAQLYKSISSANMLLEHIEGQESIFEQGMYNIIKGEALAIRAYCHLDLLRLFGPMPENPGNSVVLPYVRTVSIQYHPHHTYNEYTGFLEEDLLAAENLLKPYDPVRAENTILEKLSIQAADFLKARQLRFNYYAIKALEARFYLWMGGEENKTKACACAKEVIDATDSEKYSIFWLGSSEDITKEDFSFSCEHIMAIYDYKLYDKAKSNFTTSAYYARKKNIVVPQLYEAGSTDIRLSLWKEYKKEDMSSVYTITKFLQKDENSTLNQLPLLRLSEMYLIAMECGTLAEANELYREYCLSRDIPLVTLQDEYQLRNILIEQYNKEFYGEGQAFYAYKRLAVTDILWAVDPGDTQAYVIPLPTKEINHIK